MIYYDMNDASEGTDVDKPNVCNRCHDLLMMTMSLNDIAISNIKSCDYRCIISGVNKNQTINLMQNVDLTKKNRIL